MISSHPLLLHAPCVDVGRVPHVLPGLTPYSIPVSTHQDPVARTKIPGIVAGWTAATATAAFDTALFDPATAKNTATVGRLVGVRPDPPHQAASAREMEAV